MKRRFIQLLLGLVLIAIGSFSAAADEAQQAAEANGTSLAACQPDGLVVTVRVETVVHGFIVGAAASAGPPAGGG